MELHKLMEYCSLIGVVQIYGAISKQHAKNSLIGLSNADNQSCSSNTSIRLSKFSTLAMYDCGFFKDVASST